ncbi:MAG: hypothetical protein ACREPR_12535 [Brasilonema sp.]
MASHHERIRETQASLCGLLWRTKKLLVESGLSRKEQQVLKQQYLDWIRQDFSIWDKEEARKYFLAGGGTEVEFELGWQQRMEENKLLEKALIDESFHTAGGSICYLVSGYK